MAKKKILFINQEITPYVPDNALSLMGKNLPKVMQERSHEIRTFMPKWGNINERRGQLHEVIRLSGMNLIINDTDHPLIIKVIFFARGVLETVKKLRWVPDIIHCQGWMAGVVPFYVKTAYRDEPSFAETKVITSLYNKSIEKDFGSDFKQFMEFRDAKPELLTDYKDTFDFDELGKLAIDYSDGVIQAVPDASKVLSDYAAAKNKPLLGYQEDFGDAYEAFYESLYADEAK